MNSAKLTNYLLIALIAINCLLLGGWITTLHHRHSNKFAMRSQFHGRNHDRFAFHNRFGYSRNYHREDYRGHRNDNTSSLFINR
jgi:hypothetical protein